MRRCDLCPGVHACLPPSGPQRPELLFIGEAPGRVENQKGKVFCGATGEEVNRHYLPLAGLRREAVGFINAIGCFPVSAGGKLDPHRPKDLALLQSCATCHLYPAIERSRARLLIPMGAFACRAVCPGVELDLHHGIPTDTDWGIPAFPMFHPALGIHEPKRMLHIRTDWTRLRAYLSGELRLPIDDYPNPDYREVTDAREVQDIRVDRPLAADTESTRQRQPYCLTYSQEAGTGRLIRADRADILRAFDHRMQTMQAPILFHHWLYDWPVTEALGLALPHRLIVDTLSRVFHLGNLPQGLKALATRELGMVMQDFDDVVTPHSRKLVMAYYLKAEAETWQKPDEELVQGSKTGKWKLYKPQSMNTKLKRFFTDYLNNPEKDPFEAWDNWETSHAMVQERLGEWPGKCISHVPFEQATYYACRDADALLRLWPVLKLMKANVRHTTQEHWRS